MNIDYTCYFDQYGMVGLEGTHPAPNTDNGLLFTAVAMQSCEVNNDKTYPWVPDEFEYSFNECFIDGILYRRPELSSSPDSHDNYEAAILGSLLESNTRSPRKLLWSLITHFGLIRGEFLARFPQLMLLWPAAFPWMAYPMFPLIYLLCLFQQPDTHNAGINHLQFNLVSAIDMLYPKLNLLKKWFTKLKVYGTMYDVMLHYYGPDHPTTLVWKDSKIC